MPSTKTALHRESCCSISSPIPLVTITIQPTSQSVGTPLINHLLHLQVSLLSMSLLWLDCERRADTLSSLDTFWPLRYQRNGISLGQVRSVSSLHLTGNYDLIREHTRQTFGGPFG